MRPTQALARKTVVRQPSKGFKFPNSHYDQPHLPMRADWHPINVHNLVERNNGALASQFDFSRSRDSLFKILGSCKAALREYWMPSMKDRFFRRWYLPTTLPTMQPTAITSPTLLPSAKSITKWTRPGKDGGRHAVEAAELHSYLAAQAPTGPFMFRELERRMDHVLFRGGFADSVEMARGIIGSGAVRLNGNIETQRHLRLLPGDFLEINPAALPFLNRPPLEHVGLADKTSKGLSYDLAVGARKVLVELVGLTPKQAAFALTPDARDAEEAEAAKAAEEEEGEEGESEASKLRKAEPARAPTWRARAVLEAWLDAGGAQFGADMAPPLAQETIKALLELPVTAADVRTEAEQGQSLRERRIRREGARAGLTAEEVAVRLAEDDGAAGGKGLFLTDEDEPSAAITADVLAVRSNAGVQLTPTHYPALPTDPSGTRDFHLPPFAGPGLFVPAYLQPNYRYCTLTYVRHPQARHNYNEIPSPFNAKGDAMRRAWEWYRARKLRRKTYAGGLYPGGIDARARRLKIKRGPEVRRSGVHEDFY